MTTSTSQAAPPPAAMPDAGLRPSILQLAIRDKAALHAAYMGFIDGGGLFVPTNRAAQLGDDVFAIVSLPDDQARLPIPGKVCWITPAGVPGRQQGIGMRFANNEAGEQARMRIEKLLTGSLTSTRPTHTL
jgi:type IV pilus assembly protein PilZ